ncbi:MAG: hypothetical protein QME94_17340 [Anaerolineae bacterium]|nr:hypothetical protein [Anaerolineae bacterium]
MWVVGVHAICKRILVIAAIGASCAATALAAPPLPFSPWGMATVGGVPAPAGTEVTAWIGGVQCGRTTTVEDGWYALDVPGDDPDTPEVDGGRSGDPVVLRVGGQAVAEPHAYQAGVSLRVDLALEVAPVRVWLPLVLRGS